MARKKSTPETQEKNGSRLIGFARKSKNGGAIKLNLSVEALDNCKSYEGKGGEFIGGIVINLDRLKALINGEREVVAVSQL